MKKQSYDNIEIPEELSISNFKERYSKMTLNDAYSTLGVELRKLDARFNSMKSNNPYLDATNKMIIFMKELMWLIGQCHRPSSAGDYRFDELKSLLQQICDNSNIPMPKIKENDEE